jgi:hypothetical protein
MGTCLLMWIVIIQGPNGHVGVVCGYGYNTPIKNGKPLVLFYILKNNFTSI